MLAVDFDFDLVAVCVQRDGDSIAPINQRPRFILQSQRRQIEFGMNQWRKRRDQSIAAQQPNFGSISSGLHSQTTDTVLDRRSSRLEESFGPGNGCV